MEEENRAFELTKYSNFDWEILENMLRAWILYFWNYEVIIMIKNCFTINSKWQSNITICQIVFRIPTFVDRSSKVLITLIWMIVHYHSY